MADTRDVLIGIDVGWSQRRRSCALAILGIPIAALPAQHRGRFAGYAPWQAGLVTSYCALFRLDELVAYLPGLMAALTAAGINRVVVVIDGPIGPDGPPQQDRRVDAACGRGEFYQRAQPMPVTSRDGQQYVAATYRIIEAMAGWQHQFWLGGQVPQSGLVIAETNPTVAMAMLVPQEPVNDLPTRHRPQLVNPGTPHERLIKAKSDWYWLRGANTWTSNILMSEAVANEEDHERVAGLFCLALAERLARNTAIALGDEDGIYAIPCGPLHHDWMNAVQGTLPPGAPVDKCFQAGRGNAITSMPHPVHGGPPATDGEDERGDEVDLYLCDPGGVWEKHNHWLAGLRAGGPVQAVALDGDFEKIHLAPANADGMWTSEPRTCELTKPRGVPCEQLNLQNIKRIPVHLDTLMLAGAGDQPADADLVGTWTPDPDDEQWTFNEDETLICPLFQAQSTYAVRADVLVITSPVGNRAFHIVTYTGESLVLEGFGEEGALTLTRMAE